MQEIKGNIICPNCSKEFISVSAHSITIGNETQFLVVTCLECGRDIQVGPITSGYDFGPEGQPDH